MPKRKPSKATKIVYSDDDDDDEIQTFHKQRDKIHLDSDRDDSDEAEEEEVYRLEDSDSEDEEIAQMEQQVRQIKRNTIRKKLGSDLEDDTEDEELPDSRAWGSKQSWFIGGDVKDNKIILSGEEDEAGAAALEEKEMEEIQKRQLARMSEDDYLPPSMLMRSKRKEQKEMLKNKMSSKKTDDEEKEEMDDGEKEEEVEKDGKKKKGKKKETKKTKSLDQQPEKDEHVRIQVKPDFTKMPKEAELERMKKLHPEYTPLLNDFRLKMRELQERIIPLMALVKDGIIEEGVGSTYLQMKYHIICNYLLCGGFYMYFLALRKPRIQHHPVMKRLLELQQFYNRLVPVDQRVKADLDEILELKRQGKPIGKVISAFDDGTTSSMASSRKRARKAEPEVGVATKKRKTKDRQETEFAELMEDDDENDQGNLDEADVDEDVEQDEDVDEDDQDRRAITYEMEKNKGLTAHKKKELKNPRVKHRKKYRRALIRRKGQVRDYNPPKTAYSGEMTGIRAGIIRSRKLK